MFADTLTVTVGGSAKSLTRTGTALDFAAYSTADRAYRLTAAHNYGRRTRRNVKLQFDSLIASPLIAGQNVNQSLFTYLVVDLPPGYDTTVAKANVDGFLGALTASSGLLVGKLLSGES